MKDKNPSSDGLILEKNAQIPCLPCMLIKKKRKKDRKIYNNQDRAEPHGNQGEVREKSD